nr:zinc finger, CCHC-type [Tanacetum cinerariifolium]
MTLEEAIGRLKTYEERIKYKKGKQVDHQERLMFTRHDNRGKHFRGRGRGKHRVSYDKNHENFKERENSHKSYNENNFKKPNHDNSKIRCYKCKKIGYIAPNCPQRTNPNEQSNLVEEDLEPTLLMATLEEEEYDKVSLHQEDVGYKKTNMDSLWYLDNGASNHMTGIMEHFKELDEKVGGKAEAIRHAIHILNSVPTKALEDITPYEAIKCRKPNLANLKVFGCIAYAKVPSQHLTKLDGRSTKMVYLGNEHRSKAYRLFDPTTQKICVESEWSDFRIENLDVTDEHHDQEIPPIEEDKEFPHNDDDFYASPTRNS